jgi:hypothetical protein
VIGVTLFTIRKNMVVEIWPENWPAWVLFNRMSTQWRVGMGGASGLDYNVLFRFLDRMRLSDSDYDQMLADISVLEDTALSEIHSGTP